MADMTHGDAAPEADEVPVGAIRIRCHSCTGAGYVQVARMGVIDGQSGTLTVPSKCRDCKGTGYCGWMMPRPA